MNECDYEFECSRAELLGIPLPSREEFLARKITLEGTEADVDVDDITTEQLENIDIQGEGISRASGGLDELNNILTITQTKINRFKTVCGSFTNLLKLKVSGKTGKESDSNSVSSLDVDGAQDANDGTHKTGEGEVTKKQQVPLRSGGCPELGAQVGSQVDKLDSIIAKAERAELSIASQNKQMRQFLNK